MMELLRLTIIIGIISAASALTDTDGFEYLPSTNSLYKFIERANWTSLLIEVNCKANGEGARIWVPSSAQEVGEVMNIFKKQNFTFVWLGIAKYPDFDHFMTDIKGRENFYRNWVGENSTQSNELTVKMSRDGEYSLDSTNNDLPAICVKRDIKYTFNISDGYTSVEQFNASYKLYDVSLKTNDADLKCRQNGATLWVPESKEEVETIFKTVVPAEDDQILIGIHNYTQDVEKRNYYSNWDVGYPKDGFTDMDTIVLRNGLYINGNFSEKFICKRTSKPEDGFWYLTSTNASYKFIEDSDMIYVHELRCQAIGASMWIPSSAQEVDQVLGIFQNRYYEYLWLGIMKDFDEFLDLNGRNDFYRNWGGKNDTALLGVTMDKNGTYSTRFMYSKYPSICVRKQESTYLSNNLNDYTRIDQFDASYKLSTTQSDVSGGFLRCLREDATLWVPESEEEVKVIFKTIIPVQEFEDQVLVGIHNYLKNGYITIKGNRNYYSRWLSGHPDDSNQDTLVFRNGTYKTGGFYRKFVCKRKSKPGKASHWNNMLLDSFINFYFNNMMSF